MPCDYTNYARERGKDTDQSGFWLRDLTGSMKCYRTYNIRKSNWELLAGLRFAPYSSKASYLRCGIRPVIKIKN